MILQVTRAEDEAGVEVEAHIRINIHTRLHIEVATVTGVAGSTNTPQVGTNEVEAEVQVATEVDTTGQHFHATAMLRAMGCDHVLMSLVKEEVEVMASVVRQADAAGGVGAGVAAEAEAVVAGVTITVTVAGIHEGLRCITEAHRRRSLTRYMDMGRRRLRQQHIATIATDRGMPRVAGEMIACPTTTECHLDREAQSTTTDCHPRRFNISILQ